MRSGPGDLALGPDHSPVMIPDPGLQCAARTTIPTQWGTFVVCCFETSAGQTDHIALLRGEIGDGRDVLVRIHSGCVTGDILGSRRCDCGQQLRVSMHRIASEGRGVVVYLIEHEGRGIGLLRKLQAYELQDGGADTVDANVALGMPVDARQYGRAAEVLRLLGVHSVRLLTNNPGKITALEEAGIEVVRRVELQMEPTAENMRYLATKRDRLGHEISTLEAADIEVVAHPISATSIAGSNGGL